MPSGHQQDMICLETQHFNINKILLLAIGLWPYRQSKFAHFQVAVFSVILITAVIFQLTTFLTSKCTPNFVLNVLSSTFFFMTFIILYNSFQINMENVKDLLEKLQNICNKLEHKHEIAIMERYGYYAKYCTILLAIFGLFAISASFISQLWLIFDIVKSTNLFPRHLLFQTEYFVDRKKNFYLNFVHMNIACFIGAIVAIAIGTTQFTYIQHICGMFKIASYRIQHAIELNVGHYKSENITIKNNTLISREISYAVDMHRQAMKLAKLLENRFETSYCWLIIFGVASLSLNIHRISQIDSFRKEANELLVPFLLAFTCILFMFLANYCGQDVTDHNNDVFDTAYNTQWYTASLYTQKLMLFLLQRNVKDFTIGVGGLFVASFDCFLSLVKASVSYFTFIYSTQ